MAVTISFFTFGDRSDLFGREGGAVEDSLFESDGDREDKLW